MLYVYVACVYNTLKRIFESVKPKALSDLYMLNPKDFTSFSPQLDSIE